MEGDDEKLVWRWRERLQCSIEGCGDLCKVDLRSFAEYEELDGGHRALQRYQSIPEEIGQGLADVRLRKRVKRVEWGEKGVRVELEDGSELIADSAVATVSVGVLKSCCDELFEPPLPRSHLKALDQIEMGCVEKVFVRLQKTQEEGKKSDQSVGEGGLGSLHLLWEDADDQLVAWVRSISSFTSDEGRAVGWWCGWVSGRAACLSFADQSNDEKLSSLNKAFARYVPGIIATELNATSWAVDKNFFGSYSYKLSSKVAPDLACSCLPGRAEQRPAYEQLHAPLCDSNGNIRVALAGEALSRNFYGTAHGAFLDGERAADLLLGLGS